MILAAIAAVVIGVMLGLLGGGGTILTVPILVYGLAVGTKEAIAVSLVVVGATAAISLVAHARAGHVRWRTGFAFGAAGMVGAYLGGMAGARLPATVLLTAFAAMMAVTAIAMLRSRGSVRSVAGTDPDDAPPRPAFSKILAEGLAVGAITGLVGAGGGFLVVPALALLGGLSMRDAVGTSLLVIALKSGAGAAGYLGQVSIDWSLAGTMVAFAGLGSIVGARLTHRLPQAVLRKGFAIFVLAMAVVMVTVELVGSAAG